MKSINPRKALGLGGLLLIVTLAAGCAGEQGWLNNHYGYSGGGYGSAYPNLDASDGPIHTMDESSRLICRTPVEQRA